MVSSISHKQLKHFNNKLTERSIQLREEIRQELKGYEEERYQELAGKVSDLEDKSVADLLVDLKLADIDRHINEFQEIEAAMSRIASRTYGVCQNCDGEIGVDRLDAFPVAKRCCPCQSQYEKDHAGHRVHSL